MKCFECGSGNLLSASLDDLRAEVGAEATSGQLTALDRIRALFGGNAVSVFCADCGYVTVNGWHPSVA